ncbi:MAG: hypothetical protein ACXV7J_06645 [Methylomonas sp.]
MLIWGSIIFSFYCIPWSDLYGDNGWVRSLFLIDDWSDDAGGDALGIG